MGERFLLICQKQKRIEETHPQNEPNAPKKCIPRNTPEQHMWNHLVEQLPEMTDIDMRE